MIRKLLLVSSALSLLALSAQGQVIHDEGLDGDLSGDFTMPDALVVADGANTIVGQIGNNGDTGATNGQDADYLSITLGAGESITAITVDSFTFDPTDPGMSFLGYVAGAAFTGQEAGDIDGNVLFSAGSGDILPGLAGGPLGEGTWSFWLQETADTVVDYELTFTVVPEPSAPMMLVFGAAGLLAVRRRLRSAAE